MRETVRSVWPTTFEEQVQVVLCGQSSLWPKRWLEVVWAAHAACPISSMHFYDEMTVLLFWLGALTEHSDLPCCQITQFANPICLFDKLQTAYPLRWWIVCDYLNALVPCDI